MSSEPTQRSRRTPSDEELPSLLEALAAGGGTTAAFAREHGLTTWKLYAAKRVAAKGGPRRRRRSRADGEFVRVQVVEEGRGLSVPLELVLGSGHRLLIPSGFDETTLRRLMGVLASC
jgi:hypothetical protein